MKSKKNNKNKMTRMDSDGRRLKGGLKDYLDFLNEAKVSYANYFL